MCWSMITDKILSWLLDNIYDGWFSISMVAVVDIVWLLYA